jgi:hypothetical protein
MVGGEAMGMEIVGKSAGKKYTAERKIVNKSAEKGQSFRGKMFKDKNKFININVVFCIVIN